jgi:mRNA interferase MazF
MTTMPPKPAFNRGDVVLVSFLNADLTTAKTRPALIIQANNLQTGLPQIIVAIITSQMFRSGHPSRLTIRLDSPAGKQSGLLTDSVVMTDNLATITLSAVYRVIGTMPTTDVDVALKHTLNLP